MHAQVVVFVVFDMKVEPLPPTYLMHAGTSASANPGHSVEIWKITVDASHTPGCVISCSVSFSRAPQAAGHQGTADIWDLFFRLVQISSAVMHPECGDGRKKGYAAGAVQDPQAAEGHFGFPVDNTIGGTPQYNGWMNNWVGDVLGRETKLTTPRCSKYCSSLIYLPCSPALESAVAIFVCWLFTTPCEA